MKLSATITGLADLQRVIAALGPVTMKEGVAGLYQEALIEQKESMRRTPVLTGALRASHETEKPVMVNPKEAVIRILVGGPAGAGFARFAKSRLAKGKRVSLQGTSAIAQVVDPSGYALYVHENLDADHHVGQAKFLESTINESRPYMPGRVAKRISLIRIVSAARKAGVGKK